MGIEGLALYRVPPTTVSARIAIATGPPMSRAGVLLDRRDPSAGDADIDKTTIGETAIGQERAD